MSITYSLPRAGFVKQFLTTVGNKSYKFGTVIRRHRKMIEERQTHFMAQLLNLGIVVVAAVGIMLLNWFMPGFFTYPYFRWSVELEVILRFWPVFAWCGALILFQTFAGDKLYSSDLDEKVLGWGLLTGNMAALWEELGFRGSFICYSMISIMMMNWVLGTVLVWGLVIILMLATLGLVVSDDTPTIVALIPGMLTLLFIWLAGTVDPLYWFYTTVTMSVLNFLSFGSFSDIMNPELHNPLFVMGAILANIWFRDGHKYQGIFGLLDSWLLGFVFLFAMMTHGLLTAMALHGIWNTSLYLSNYMRRKFAS